MTWSGDGTPVDGTATTAPYHHKINSCATNTRFAFLFRHRDGNWLRITACFSSRKAHRTLRCRADDSTRKESSGTAHASANQLIPGGRGRSHHTHVRSPQYMADRKGQNHLHVVLSEPFSNHRQKFWRASGSGCGEQTAECARIRLELGCPSETYMKRRSLHRCRLGMAQAE